MIADDLWNEGGERIAKRLARAGVCSRRDAERLILDGRVSVNGQVLDTPAFKVDDQDDIRVDNRPIPQVEATRAWRYHKPSGLVTTHRDPENRATVFQHLPPDMPRVISVGRLDLTSEGLLLLTNDGELARMLELPSMGWVRRYRARAYGMITQDVLDQLRNGITIEGMIYGAIEAKLERQQGSNAWISVAISEGKNREVRRVLEYLGLRVNRLIRLSYGPFQLGLLEPGDVEEIPRKVLREQLGLARSKTLKSQPKRPSRSAQARSAEARSAQARAAGDNSEPEPVSAGAANPPRFAKLNPAKSKEPPRPAPKARTVRKPRPRRAQPE